MFRKYLNNVLALPEQLKRKAMFEKEIKREDGTTVKIMIDPYFDGYPKKVIWGSWFVMQREKGKKKWRGVGDSNSYEYRNLSMPERREFMKRKYLEVVTPAEVNAAMLSAWEQLKPEPIQ